MRVLLLFVCLGLTISAAYWAYQENYRTQATLKAINKLHTRIGLEREAISVLNAEWAYLNRPDRLRELVDLNFLDLELVPLSSEHFGETATVAYPQNLQATVNAPVTVSGSTGDAQ
jgi:hypothetical protein